MNPDGISRLLAHVGLHVNTFYAGSLCGLHRFGADEGVGHLHVIRSGQLRASRAGRRVVPVREPCLLFSRAFIRELGISPSGWLRAQKAM